MVSWEKRTKQTFVAALAVGLVSAVAARAETEEQRLVRIAKQLKPISASQWNEIAGTRITDVYEVQKDDTLWSVSRRLFGNANYWPKVWALNNSGIGNPHVIEPGQRLGFSSGSSEAVPQLQPVEGSASPTPVAARTLKEYEKLPPEMWAPLDPNASVAMKEYDSLGIDKNLKIRIPRRMVFRVPVIANDTKFSYLGEIVGSRRDGLGLGQGDTVFLKSTSSELQVGTTYNVLSEPEFIREPRSDRTGFGYNVIGEIKIVSVQDELFVGVITGASDVIRRGDRVYPLLPLITEFNPTPASSAVEAMVLTSASRTSNSSQFSFVHLDRGLEDGVQAGNVFRFFEYTDPSTQDKLTESDILPRADAIVVHATAQYSTAMVLRAKDTLMRGDFAVLLTDVSEFERMRTGRTKESSATPEIDQELDELDELDRTSDSGLGRKEEAEIKELEQWDRTKDEAAPDSLAPEQQPAEGLPVPEELPMPESTDPLPPEPIVPETPVTNEVTPAPSLEDVAPSVETAPSAEPTLETAAPSEADTAVEPVQAAPAEDMPAE